MALKVRLKKQGRTNRAFYRLVLTDARAPRDGKYLEALGWYNPIEEEDGKKMSVSEERLRHWLSLGAQLSESAANLVRNYAPQIIQEQTNKRVAHLAHRLQKKKAQRKRAG